MRILLHNIVGIILTIFFLTACGGHTTPRSSPNDNITTCSLNQVGVLSATCATANIVCSDADGIRNTDEFPAVVTVNDVEYRMTFADNITSFDENVTVIGLPEDTNTSASAFLYVINGQTSEVDMFSAGTTNLETSPVPDTTKPVITLTGGTTSLSVGGVYTAPVVTANDNVDGDITVDIVIDGDTVDPNVAGTYTVTYDVMDSSGNNADQKTHTVIIVDELDESPDSFDFNDRFNLNLNTVYNTNTQTVSGINTEVNATTTVGNIVVNGVGEGLSAQVQNGDEVYNSVRTSGSYSTSINVMVTIGDKFDNFTFETKSTQTQ